MIIIMKQNGIRNQFTRKNSYYKKRAKIYDNEVLCLGIKAFCGTNKINCSS